MAVANHFGGVVIDICSDDWSAGVAQASNQLQLVEEVVLDHTPVSDQHIEVFVDGILWADFMTQRLIQYILLLFLQKNLIEVVYITNRIYYLFQRNIV